MTCDICGGTEIVKDNDVFVCQSCGCKYSLEEARKLMREVPDEAGSPAAAPSDAQSSQKIDNLLKLARRAKAQNDSQNAAKYYQQLLMEHPDDWEANFYTTFYAAHNVRIADLGNAVHRVNSVFQDVLTLLKQNEPNSAARQAACNEILLQVTTFKQVVFVNTLDHLGSNPDIATENLRKWAFPALSMVLNLGDKMLDVLEDYDAARVAYETVKKDIGVLNECNAQYMTLDDFKKPHPFRYNAYVKDDLQQLERDADRRLNKLSRKQQDKESQERQARAEKYWASHPEQKTRRLELEDELKKLDAQIRALLRKKDEVPAVAELADAQSRRESLVAQRDRLGMFKGREKKALQLQIDGIDNEFAAIQKRLENQQYLIQYEIDPLIERKKALQQQYNAMIAAIDTQ